MRRDSLHIVAAALLVPLTLLAGCGSDTKVVTTPPPDTVSFSGKVLDGAQPVSGLQLQIYAAATSGYAASATPLLTTTVVTDANGAFTIPAGSYSCASSGTQIYLVATSTANPAIAMMTAFGNCGSLQSSTTIAINEVTTAAAVYALAAFMSSPQQLGTSATNSVGLANAFLNAALLADISTGASPSTTLPSNLTVETAKLNTVADILASCVHNGPTACTTLFADTTSGAETLPTNTIAAALRIAKNPGRNVATLFALGTTTYTGLTTAPADFTLSIAATAASLSNPASIAIDSTGHAWAINYNGTLTGFNSQGALTTVSTSAATTQDYGLAIDPSDNIWITNGSANSISKLVANSLTTFTGGGISYPIAIASDASGNIWVVNNGNGSLAELSNSGTPISPSTGYTAAGAFPFPVSVAIDANGTPWVASQNGAATHLSASGSLLRTVACCAIPTGIAVDPNGDPWVADHYANAVIHVSASTGAVLTSTTKTGGLSDPYNLAADGAGNIWAANASNGTLTEIAGSSSTATAGLALSPSTGYGLSAALQAPYGIAIDASGNIWVTSYNDSRIVRFIGLATPVKTPLVSAPQLP